LRASIEPPGVHRRLKSYSRDCQFELEFKEGKHFHEVLEAMKESDLCSPREAQLGDMNTFARSLIDDSRKEYILTRKPLKIPSTSTAIQEMGTTETECAMNDNISVPHGESLSEVFSPSTSTSKPVAASSGTASVLPIDRDTTDNNYDVPISISGKQYKRDDAGNCTGLPIAQKMQDFIYDGGNVNDDVKES